MTMIPIDDQSMMDVAYHDTGERLEPEVVIIPASIEKTEKITERKNLRVAAYCRVSTDSEEQMTSYETQLEFYTKMINENPNWKMVKVFADEGLSATSTAKRTEFLEMMEMCKKKKIDLIITKSASRFARNTLDTLEYVRMLKSIGVAVLFEKEGINTAEMNSELILQLYAMFAQAESESISNNEKDGRRKGYQIGKVPMMYGNVLGYRKGADGQAEIDKEEASIIIYIFSSYLNGCTIGAIKKNLEARGIKTIRGNTEWSPSVILSILKNEKYKGDVIMQKSYIKDIFSKKNIKNTGELPKYIVKNHHIPIIEPRVIDKVQEELARRSNKKTVDMRGTTKKSKYSGKYALTDLVVCGECGTRYRRVTWTSRGKTRVVWRCINRLNYGKKICKHSPTIMEEDLQKAVMNAMNIVLTTKTKMSEILKGSMAAILGANKSEMRIGAITNEIAVLNNQIFEVVKEEIQKRTHSAEIEKKCAELHQKIEDLKSEMKTLDAQKQAAGAGKSRLREICEALDEMGNEFNEYDEMVVRRLVTQIKVITEEKIIITFCGTLDIEQTL